MALLIGIDSSENKKYSGVILGFDSEINNIYTKIDKVLVSCGERGAFHWKSMSQRIKKCACNKILKILMESKLRILIFEHERSQFDSKRNFYLITVPNEIASALEHQLKQKSLYIKIECDDDFNIKGVKKCTTKFLERLLINLSYRLSDSKLKYVSVDAV